MDSPPRRSQIPPVEPGAEAAWKECLDRYGYPMACPAVMAQGYFGEGYRAGLIAAEEALGGKTLRKILSPPEVPHA